MARGFPRMVVERAYMPPLPSRAGGAPRGTAARSRVPPPLSEVNASLWLNGSAAQPVGRCFLLDPGRIRLEVVAPAGRSADPRDAAGGAHDQPSVGQQLEVPAAGEGL